MQNITVSLLVLLFYVLLVRQAGAEAVDPAEVEALKNQVQSLQQTVQQLQQTIAAMQKENAGRDERLQQQVEAVQKRQSEALQARVESPLDQAVRELEQEQPQRVSSDLWSRQVGGTNLRLLDLSLAAEFYAGGSSERDGTIQTLQAGGHDPRKRGFTLAEAELGFVGAVDPYFHGQAFLSTSIDPIEGETIVELEEAYITTLGLPYELQAELGFFYTEFGIINPQHPEQWDWEDQPIINNRFFGPDGMRQAGIRVSKLLPTSWFSEFHLGVQNANGETMASFLGGGRGHNHGEEGEEANAHGDEGSEHEHDVEFNGIGNRPIIERDFRDLGDFVYLTRWRNSWDFGPTLTTAIGISGLYGPNASGTQGDTWIYGMDLKTKWRPVNNFRGWPFLIWQMEFMRRDFTADRFTLVEEEEDEVFTLPGRTLHDWGLYTQWLYGFSYRWAAGARFEYASGSGQSIDGRKNDPFRANRYRVSPLLVFHPSEFSRIRLQYNYDHGNFLVNDTKTAHSVWLGLEWLYGAHAAHEY